MFGYLCVSYPTRVGNVKNPTSTFAIVKPNIYFTMKKTFISTLGITLCSLLSNAQNTFPTAAGSNVGIGTLSPSAKLDVQGSCRITGNLDFSGNARLGSMSIYADRASNHLIFNGSPDYEYLYPNNFGNATNAAGHIGKIGFERAEQGGNPGYNFYVSNANSTAGGTFLNVFKPVLEAKIAGITITGSAVSLGTDDGKSKGTKTGQRALVHSANDALVLNWDGEFEGGVTVQGPQFTVAGKTLIGAKRPKVGSGHENFDLAVDGKLVTRSLYVTDVNQWFDNVFKKEYVLSSLNEVEAYINTNGHLKDVPSENEVKENGIGVAEMDGILLKKIEELTLYMIQMQKENEQLKARLGSLESK